jgi:hypothetical protein
VEKTERNKTKTQYNLEKLVTYGRKDGEKQNKTQHNPEKLTK